MFLPSFARWIPLRRNPQHITLNFRMITMNQPVPRKSSRPGFLLLLTVFLAAILMYVGFSWKNRLDPSPAGETDAPEATAEPAAAAAAAAATPAPAAAAPVQLGLLEEKWGFQISSIGLSRQDTAVELQYTINDPEKFSLLADETTPAYVLDQASGMNLPLKASPQSPAQAKNFHSHTSARSRMIAMPQAGSFPPPASRLIAGKTFSILLPNYDKAVRHGSKLTVVVGDLQTAELTVQ